MSKPANDTYARIIFTTNFEICPAPPFVINKKALHIEIFLNILTVSKAILIHYKYLVDINNFFTVEKLYLQHMQLLLFTV